MHKTQISIVNVWITDCNETERSFLDELLDNAEVPECCHPGDECKTVQYTFKVPCVVEDYPCGPGLDKVHVCHYSARDGYKTFCVPEADSDALRFYPKDYCGPCVGGYAVA